MASRPGLSVALVAVLALLAVGAARWWRARQEGGLGFSWSNSPLSSTDFKTLAARPDWVGVELPAEPGGSLALRGLLRAPRSAGAPWLLFFQGNSDHLLAEGQAFLEATAGAEDVGLAVVAWRGYDGSPGQPSHDGLLADADAIVRWLRADAARRGPLHVVSFSLGTLPAAATVVALQRAPREQRPRSLTLLAPYTSLRMHGTGWLSRRLAERFDALPVLAQVEVPTLVVHGELDPVLPTSMGRTVAERVPGGARLLLVPGAGHIELLGDPRVHRAVREAVLGGG